MMKRIGMSIAMALTATGCATFQQQEQAAIEPPEEAPAELTGLGAIANAAVPERACGMILWTLDGSRPTPVLRYVADEKAELNINGRPAYFSRIDASGPAAFGVTETQRFEAADGTKMLVTARFGLEFSGGAYLERGLIKIENSAGWSLITPAAGIAGCRN